VVGERFSPPAAKLAAYAAALVGPLALTGILVGISFNNPRDYAFLYLSIVAVLGVASGSGPAFLSAALSTVLVDYLFVPPTHTLSIGNSEDVVNLVVFFGAAALVGSFGSRRLNAQLRAQALATELQAANIELARLNREQAAAAALATKLADRERQVKVLEETDRIRHEFFANVSHELRTPLGGVLTGTTAILERGSLEPELRSQLSDVASAANRLTRLVSDMLDMARIEGDAVEMQIDDVDTAEALEAAIGRLRLQNPDRHVEVRIARDTPDICADWERLGQILDNLLANADHFAPPGEPVTVTAEGSSEGVVVRVIDSGPGVPIDLRDRIFERFVRGPGERGDGDGGGTGLGLAIVRGLVTAQGGRVWLEEAAPGAGGRFAFSLPAAGPASAMDAPPDGAASAEINT
jgi:K+-sensing histidine kinase KdpD